MRLPFILVSGFLLLARCPASAAAPPAEEWAPPQTVALFSIPDARSARAQWSRQGFATFWRDPAMTAFRERFETQLRQRLLKPWEQLSGIPWTDLLALTQGQLALAWVEESPANAEDPDRPIRRVPILLADTVDRAEELQSLLESAAARADASLSPATNEIAGVPFLRLDIPSKPLESLLASAFPAPDDSAPPFRPADAPPFSLWIGREGPILIAAGGAAALEGILSRLRNPRETAAASNPPIARAEFRGAGSVRWLRESLVRSGPLWSPANLNQFFETAGLHGIAGGAVEVRNHPQGWSLDVHVDVPAAQRRGLFRVLEPVARNAAPLPQFPDSLLTFARVRIPGDVAWQRALRTLGEIDSSILGLVQLFASYAGRTEDADFDFEKGVIARLGDDWSVAQFVGGPEDPEGRLFLLGSPEAAELLPALRRVASPTYLSTFLPPGAPAPTRRDWNYEGAPGVSIFLPALPFKPGETGAVHFASAHGYVAFSSNLALVEKFIGNPPERPLAEAPWFRACLEAAGGADGGCLGFRNERETARRFLAEAERSPEIIADAIHWVALSNTATRVASATLGWLDLSLLPPHDAVARHFGPCVHSGRADDRGFHMSIFRPLPEETP